jgi:hypothetical protein
VSPEGGRAAALDGAHHHHLTEADLPGVGTPPRGARIGITAVLHTWGSAITHHQHVHMIVPGVGIALDSERWWRADPASFSPSACSRSGWR